MISSRYDTSVPGITYCWQGVLIPSLDMFDQLLPSLLISTPITWPPPPTTQTHRMPGTCLHLPPADTKGNSRPQRGLLLLSYLWWYTLPASLKFPTWLYLVATNFPKIYLWWLSIYPHHYPMVTMVFMSPLTLCIKSNTGVKIKSYTNIINS